MLGDKIRALRKTAGLSQEELGDMLGVSRQAVSKWEVNQSQPEIQNIIQLATIFKVPVNVILSDEEPLPKNTQLKDHTRARMLFQLGAILTVCGFSSLMFFMYIIKDLIVWCGNPIRLLISEIRDHTYSTVIWFAILILIIIIGIILCIVSIPRKSGEKSKN